MDSRKYATYIQAYILIDDTSGLFRYLEVLVQDCSQNSIDQSACIEQILKQITSPWSPYFTQILSLAFEYASSHKQIPDEAIRALEKILQQIPKELSSDLSLFKINQDILQCLQTESLTLEQDLQALHVKDISESVTAQQTEKTKTYFKQKSQALFTLKNRLLELMRYFETSKIIMQESIKKLTKIYNQTKDEKTKTDLAYAENKALETQLENLKLRLNGKKVELERRSRDLDEITQAHVKESMALDQREAALALREKALKEKQSQFVIELKQFQAHQARSNPANASLGSSSASTGVAYPPYQSYGDGSYAGLYAAQFEGSHEPRDLEIEPDYVPYAAMPHAGTPLKSGRLSREPKGEILGDALKNMKDSGRGKSNPAISPKAKTDPLGDCGSSSHQKQGCCYSFTQIIFDCCHDILDRTRHRHQPLP
ncbi:MAG: hypothetical protein ACKOAD_07300 [Gammaproteobacteria bacterium]